MIAYALNGLYVDATADGTLLAGYHLAEQWQSKLAKDYSSCWPQAADAISAPAAYSMRMLRDDPQIC